jgi:hypothetical protein
MTTQDYLDLITSEHQNSPNYLATVSLTVTPQVDIQTLITALIQCFDIDDTNNCVGVWLNIVGQWVGASRLVQVPISGVYFTWDDIAQDGWNSGVWQDPNDPGALTSLPDDVYRTLIRAAIAANHWDGTTEGAYDIWEQVFPNLNILIQDNQDMTMSIGFQGTAPDALTLALIEGGYIQLKPEGVGIKEYFIPVDTNPLFGWDISTTYVGGWNTSSWAKEVPPT